MTEPPDGFGRGQAERRPEGASEMRGVCEAGVVRGRGDRRPACQTLRGVDEVQRANVRAKGRADLIAEDITVATHREAEVLGDFPTSTVPGRVSTILYATGFTDWGYDWAFDENMVMCIESYIGAVGDRESVTLERRCWSPATEHNQRHAPSSFRVWWHVR